MALLAIVLLSSLALSLGTLTSSVQKLSDHDVRFDQGAYIARAGIEIACAETLIDEADWGALDPGTVVEPRSFGNGTVEVELLSSDATHVLLRSIATVGGVERILQFELERDDPGSGNGNNGNGNGNNGNGNNGNGNGNNGNGNNGNGNNGNGNGNNGNGNGNGGGNGNGNNGNGNGNGGGNGNGNNGNGNGNGGANTTPEWIRLASVTDVSLSALVD